MQDARFNKDIDKKTGYRTNNILCMPILDNDAEVVGVAQIVNKMSHGGQTAFSAADEEVFPHSSYKIRVVAALKSRVNGV